MKHQDALKVAVQSGCGLSTVLAYAKGKRSHHRTTEDAIRRAAVVVGCWESMSEERAKGVAAKLDEGE